AGGDLAGRPADAADVPRRGGRPADRDRRGPAGDSGDTRGAQVSLSMDSSVRTRTGESCSHRTNQPILVELLVEPHTADPQLGGGAQPVVVVLRERRLD